jgi:hypothetical protein
MIAWWITAGFGCMDYGRMFDWWCMYDVCMDRWMMDGLKVDEWWMYEGWINEGWMKDERLMYGEESMDE